MSLDGKEVTPGHNSKKEVSGVIWVFVETTYRLMPKHRQAEGS